MEQKACCSGENLAFSICDECPALLEQVPETFFLGTTSVGLRCFDVSKNYFVFGSDCGAMFPFNRRLNRSATPLRTNYDEIIACIRLFSGINDMLAAGHESGILVVLRFPSGSSLTRRKMQQHLDPHMHQGHGITCLEWNANGTLLFSADSSGGVYQTMVDFDNETFQSRGIYSECSNILQMSYASNFLCVYSEKKVAIINLANEQACIELQETPFSDCGKLGICMVGQLSSVMLIVATSRGDVYQYDGETGSLRDSSSLKDDDQLLSDGSSSEEPCRIFAFSPTLFLYYFDRTVVFFSTDDGFKVVARRFMDEVGSAPCKVMHIAVDYISPSSFYLLTGDKRVFRLSSEEAPVYLTAITERPQEFSPRSLLSSIHKTTKLLPFAATGAILNRLKAKHHDLPLSSLPNLTLPIFGSLLSSGETLLKNSVSACNLKDESKQTAIKGGLLEDQPDAPKGSQLELNGSRLSNCNEDNNASSSSNLYTSWIGNVNEVSKYVVDVVGGAGIPVREGFFAEEPSSPTLPTAVETQELPDEEVGVHGEVRVQRTKKATGRKKQSSGSSNSSALDPPPVHTDDVTPVNGDLLTNIREALFVATTSSPHEISESDTTETDEEVLPEAADPCLSDAPSKPPTPLPCLEYVEYRPPSVCSDVGNKDPALTVENYDKLGEVDAVSQHAAYDKLMKDALIKKPLRFASLAEEVEFFDGELNETTTVFTDRGDIWNEIRLPSLCSSFSVTSKYIVACDVKKKSHPRFTLLSGCGQPQWLKMRQKAEFVAINDDNSLLWRIENGVAYSPILKEGDNVPLLLAPNWQAVANEVDGVAEVTLTRDTAWYTTKNGQVYTQLRLPTMGILSRCECPWRLHSIAASEVAVWALQSENDRLVVRAGLKYCPMGLDWVEIEPEGPARLLSVCLFGQSGWAIDSNFCLWFTNGVDFQSPFGTSGAWLQVCCPWNVVPEAVRARSPDAIVKVSSYGVFVNIGQKVYWSSSKSPVTGHLFKRIVPDKFACDDSFEMISAGSLSVGDTDFVALCRRNEVYMFRLKSRNFCSLPTVPSVYGTSILQICSLGNSVYILDSSGCIYVKKSIGKVTPFGSDWNLLDTGGCGSPIKSFSVTSRSIWVLTSDVNVFFHSRTDNAEPYVGTPTRWKQVRKDNLAVDQIRASNSGLYVWIFSTASGQGWARSCISDLFPGGKTWLEASAEPGISELAVGCKVVWCLSSTGQLYRLRGLTASNPGGNYWKAVPKKLKAISVDANDHLWGIDLGSRLVYHKVEVYPPSFDRSPTSLQQMLSTTAEEFEEFVVL